ncbi:unnamed protein product [Soboliphyme baturini]|uniref:Uncharacterized protein n=1 Tax=Soboliphyme baturini TaxID=241478 RepID=A0A183J7L9_9BILA|nr:unnamed protein product [Soboliphyme baturini]
MLEDHEEDDDVPCIISDISLNPEDPQLTSGQKTCAIQTNESGKLSLEKSVTGNRLGDEELNVRMYITA